MFKKEIKQTKSAVTIDDLAAGRNIIVGVCNDDIYALYYDIVIEKEWVKNNDEFCNVFKIYKRGLPEIYITTYYVGTLLSNRKEIYKTFREELDRLWQLKRGLYVLDKIEEAKKVKEK